MRNNVSSSEIKKYENRSNTITEIEWTNIEWTQQSLIQLLLEDYLMRQILSTWDTQLSLIQLLLRNEQESIINILRTQNVNNSSKIIETITQYDIDKIIYFEILKLLETKKLLEKAQIEKLQIRKKEKKHNPYFSSTVQWSKKYLWEMDTEKITFIIKIKAKDSDDYMDKKKKLEDIRKKLPYVYSDPSPGIVYVKDDTTHTTREIVIKLYEPVYKERKEI